MYHFSICMYSFRIFSGFHPYFAEQNNRTMNKRNRILALGSLLLATTLTWAQSDFGVWESVELSTKLNKQFELSLEGELRTHDYSAEIERMTAGIGLSYKNKKIPFLKADIGYSILGMQNPRETTIKYRDDDPTIPKHKNVDASYWYTRHRATASLTGSLKVGRFKFSLRERYQFTHRMAAECSRERYYYFYIPGMISQWDENPEYLTDAKTVKNDHKLRTRLSASYDIKGSKFEPFAEVEIYNQLDNALQFDKIRYTLGTEYKVSKKAKFNLFYRYQDYSDIDDISGHILGLGISMEL
ncbi:MAG: DUF2490 domain-containing protein [Bacteroidales bacterium]|nr:DUF2490 domain-containing protein [Bacteroidales bacterium]